MHENMVIGLLLLLGLVMNVATWYHPAYFYPVVGLIFILLPVFLVASFKKPQYLFWFILTVFFSNDSFPNNVLYETYYGYEATTIYFHNFLGFLSVFDVLLLTSLYVLFIKHLREKQVKNLFGGRIEYYIAGAVVITGLIVALWNKNDPKLIISEIQIYVYMFLVYLIGVMTIKDKKVLIKTVVFIVLYLSIIEPIEFLYYVIGNYHNLLAVVGRIRKPLLNGTDDTYMVLPVFLLLAWILDKRKSLTPGQNTLAVLGVLSGLAIIYLNTGRALALFTLALLVIFLLTRKLQFKVYLIFGLLGMGLVGMSLFLQPEHLKKVGETFTSAFSATQDLNKDMSAGDRVIEFINVHKTLEHEDAYWLGVGWAGWWDEYVYQPGRGSLASYSDKTLTHHRQTHIIISQLILKIGYLGTLIFLVAFVSFWGYCYRFYRRTADPDLKPIMLGLLFAFPIFFYFSLIYQIGICLGIMMFLMRQSVKLNEPVLTENQG